MNGFTYGRLAGLLSLLAIPAAAGASTVEFRPSSPSIAVGDSVGIDVYFVPDTPTLVGELDVTVSWDQALLDLADVSFGSLLGLPPDASEEVIVDPGTVDVFELSSGDLSGQSGMDAFRLFTLTFRGLTSGTTQLSFESVVLADDQSNAIEASAGAGSVTVTETQTQTDVDVPLPGVAWLAMLLAGIGGLKATRRDARADLGVS